MTTLLMESGTSATYGLDLFYGTLNTVGSSTECANLTPRAIKFSASTLGSVYLYKADAVAPLDPPSTGRISFKMAGPDANSNQIGTTATSQILMPVGRAAWLFNLRINSSGKLDISGVFTKAGSATVTGQSSAQLVCVTWNITSTTVFTIKVYVNGVLDISATGADGSLSAGAQFVLGYYSSATIARALYVWDIYLDDDSSNNDLGNIRVTAKLPVALNTNNFDTLGGSGTNRYDRVSERPLSATNYIQHAATSDVQENFGIQPAWQGDTNIFGAQIIARAAWAVAKRGPLGTYLLNYTGNNSKTAGTTLTLTVPVGVAVGMTFLIAFAMDGASGTVSATDNASTPNTYVVDVDKAYASPGATNARVCIIRAYVAVTTSLTTITITHPSVTARGAELAMFTGIQQSTPLDKTASAVGPSANASSGATAATTQANEVIFGALAIEDDYPAVSAGSGMTPSAADVPAGNSGTTGGGAASNMYASAIYALQTATGAQTASWTSPSDDWAAAIATYKCLSPNLGSPKLMNNGTEGSALTLTESAAAYMNIADGGGYPNNPAAVGMRSSNDEPDTYLYECGMLIAYKIPGKDYHPNNLVYQHINRAASF